MVACAYFVGAFNTLFSDARFDTKRTDILLLKYVLFQLGARADKITEERMWMCGATFELWMELRGDEPGMIL